MTTSFLLADTRPKTREKIQHMVFTYINLKKYTYIKVPKTNKFLRYEVFGMIGTLCANPRETSCHRGFSHLVGSSVGQLVSWSVSKLVS